MRQVLMSIILLLLVSVGCVQTGISGLPRCGSRIEFNGVLKLPNEDSQYFIFAVRPGRAEFLKLGSKSRDGFLITSYTNVPAGQSEGLSLKKKYSITVERDGKCWQMIEGQRYQWTKNGIAEP